MQLRGQSRECIRVFISVIGSRRKGDPCGLSSTARRENLQPNNFVEHGEAHLLCTHHLLFDRYIGLPKSSQELKGSKCRTDNMSGDQVRSCKGPWPEEGILGLSLSSH